MMTRSSTWKEEHQLHSSWEQFTLCVIFLSKNNSTTITQSSLNFTAKKVSGWISNICFWLCYTFTDLMATFQPQIDCVSSHCLTIPKGKWFSMLITSRKNENVATLLTSFMTSTMGSFSLAEFWIVASTCCSSKNLEVVNESTFSPITLRMRSSPHMIFKSGWRCCGQELCKITRDEL